MMGKRFFNRMRSCLEWTSDRLDFLCRYFVATMMAAMTVIIATQVFYRYILNQPLAWTEEIARYLMIWVTFLGSAMAVKYGEHIGVTFIVERFPQRLQTVIGIVLNLSITFFFLMGTWQGTGLTLRVLPQLAPATWISMSWAYACIPVGCFIMFIHTLVNLTRNPRDLSAHATCS